MNWPTPPRSCGRCCPAPSGAPGRLRPRRWDAHHRARLTAAVAPLLLVATVVLSFGAALGVSTLAFDHLFGFAGADPVVSAVDLSVPGRAGTDYNIFLMTRCTRRPDSSVPARRADRPCRHWRERSPPPASCWRDLRRRADAAAGVRHRDRLRGGVRGAAGHLHRPLGAGHRPEPGRRPLDVVARPLHRKHDVDSTKSKLSRRRSPANHRRRRDNGAVGAEQAGPGRTV
jgi:MMPL family